MKHLMLASLMTGGLLLAGPAGAQDVVKDLPQTKLTVVGGLSNLTAYQNFEHPFWTKTVPTLSDGKVTADIKGFNDMGLKGPEVLRLIGQGVIPFGSATLSYFASDDAINEAIDLAGLAPTIDIARQVTDAFAPIYDKYYAAQGIKVLGFSTYAAQVLFCNAPVEKLADLKGKKVRTSSRTQAEFVEAVGGSSVTIPFPEVVPALQNRVVDCGITGSMSGYSAKWYEVATHLYALPVNWNQQIHAANQAYWDKIDPKVQAFLESNLPAVYDGIWKAAARETQEGLDCNTGADSCPHAEKGKMKLVVPSDEDRAELKRITAEIVVPKWAARCSAQCVNDFNATIGKALGFTASK